eukprot:TRINITY_DN12824_c0_g1_i1.p1 TRINITY_DN12824_c0_g1~~TRINITY_DN12824_c0_g1_i1.p1  ORF type:complete len:273 (+),score=73.60 TRINITY_DN12824_c0_g1_i1:141-959(+)
MCIRDRCERKLQRQKEEKAMAERSSTLKRKLPRPVSIAEESVVFVSESESAQYTLEKEMFDMISDDNARFPTRGGDKSTETAAYAAKSKSSLQYLTQEELLGAKNLLQEELVNVMSERSIPEPEECTTAWSESVKDLILLPSQQCASKSKAQGDEIQLALNQQFDLLRQQMTKDAKKANKLEKRLMTLNTGYEKRATQLIKETQVLFEQYQQAEQQKACFEKLQAQESIALPKRLTILKEELEIVKKRESDLQQRYARLKFELDDARVTCDL